MVNTVSFSRPGTPVAPLGPRITPQQIERRRRLAEAMMATSMNTSPVQSIGEGLARMGHAALGGWLQHRADETETEQRRETTRRLAEAMGGFGRGESGPPLAEVMASHGPTTPTPARIPPAPSGGDPGMLLPATTSAFEAAQTAFGQPLTITSGYRSQDEQDALYAADLAAHGGQPSGLVAQDSQHTEGTAVDISTAGMSPAQKAELVRTLRAQGFTSFGEYEGHIHADMRPEPATWTDFSPEVAAALAEPLTASTVTAMSPYEVGTAVPPGGNTPTPAAASPAAPQHAGGMDLAQAMALLNDPYLSPAAGQAVGTMLAQQLAGPQTPEIVQFQRGDQIVSAYMTPNGPVEFSSAPRWQPQAPQTGSWRPVPDRGVMVNDLTGETRPLGGEAALDPGQFRPVPELGIAVNTATGEQIPLEDRSTPEPEPAFPGTGSTNTLLSALEEGVRTGRTNTPEYMTAYWYLSQGEPVRQPDGSVMMVPRDMSQWPRPDGYDPAAPAPLPPAQAPAASPNPQIIESPTAVREREEAEEQEALREQTERRQATVVTEEVRRAMEIIATADLPTTGFVGGILQNIGGTAARDLEGLLATIRANVGFERLQQMREESPTGGALGQVTENERRALEATLGNLEQSQSADQLIYNLIRLNNQTLDIVHDFGRGPGRMPPRDVRAFEPGQIYEVDGVLYRFDQGRGGLVREDAP